jgi:hypothetical protein
MFTSRPLGTPEAIAHFRNRWGLKFSHNYMAKLASKGGGPRYTVVGRRRLYTVEDLDAYGATRASPLMESANKPAEIQPLRSASATSAESADAA